MNKFAQLFAAVSVLTLLIQPVTTQSGRVAQRSASPAAASAQKVEVVNTSSGRKRGFQKSLTSRPTTNAMD
jgi:hypothetical protein